MRLLRPFLCLVIAAMNPPSAPAAAEARRDRDIAEIQVSFRDASRRVLDVTTQAYRFSVDLDKGALRDLRPADAAGPGLDAALAVRGGDRLYAPRAGRGRINIDRFGPLMYDIHLRDLEFASSSSAGDDVLSVWPDLMIRAYPDRIHLNFVLTSTDAAGVLAPLFVYGGGMHHPSAEAGCGWAFFGGVGEGGAGGPGVFVIPLGPDDRARVLSDAAGPGLPAAHRVQSSAGGELRQRGDRISLAAALVPSARRGDGLAVAAQILNALPDAAFVLDGGTHEGPDPAWGLHQIRTDVSGPRHFEVAHVNPNSHVRTDLRIENDDRPRTLYLRVYNDYGTLEATVLTDRHGVPLPVQVQTGKNFAGEMEEGELEGDHAFGESILRLDLEAGEVFEGRALHLFGNWGNHPLKQISSIRFFRHYFHASIGPTETMCYSPFPYPRGDGITYTLADVRGLSTPMWPGQPQHDHVSVIGYLRYRTTDGWIHPRLTRTSIHHTGPNFARMAMEYRMDDERAGARLEFFELPQTDETRCFSRIRYEFDRELPLAGPPCETLRFVNAGAYIVGTVHGTVDWIAEDGSRRTKPIPADGSFTLRGETLGRETPFVAAYPHKHGNILLLVRSWEARLGGEDAPPAVTVQGGERFTEVYLTAPAAVERILPGDFVEAEIVVIPYGDAGPTADTPAYEREHYGMRGPAIQILRGDLVESFPWRVRVDARGVAEAKVAGGLDNQVFIVEGLSERRWPMLWENLGGWMLVDPQVHGNDGAHFHRCADGAVGAVFVVNTRPGQEHHYLVCEPPDHGPVRAVTVRNGRVTVEYEGGAPVVLEGPPLPRG